MEQDALELVVEIKVCCTLRQFFDFSYEIFNWILARFNLNYLTFDHIITEMSLSLCIPVLYTNNSLYLLIYTDEHHNKSSQGLIIDWLSGTIWWELSLRYLGSLYVHYWAHLLAVFVAPTGVCLRCPFWETTDHLLISYMQCLLLQFCMYDI